MPKMLPKVGVALLPCCPDEERPFVWAGVAFYAFNPLAA